jgi:nucleoside-diphosphate-sugar epimerase
VRGRSSPRRIVELLRAGYAVRATVRSSRKEEAIRAAVAGQGVPVDALGFATVDLTRDAGWDEAMAGVAYVLHVASPLSSDDGDPTAAARDGTVRVLRAACAANVTRVVMTSAAATARVPRDSTATSDETVWADPDDPRFDAYRRSKILAEQAAWELMAARRGPTTLTTILPGAVFGPGLVPGPLGSLQIIARMLAGKLPGTFRLAFWIVDVRDLAALHVRAMTEPAAANERFLATGELLWMRDVATTLRARLGARAAKVRTRELPSWLVRGLAFLAPPLRGLVPELGRRNDVSSAKARRVLGFAPRPAADTIADSGAYVLSASAPSPAP